MGGAAWIFWDFYWIVPVSGWSCVLGLFGVLQLRSRRDVLAWCRVSGLVRVPCRSRSPGALWAHCGVALGSRRSGAEPVGGAELVWPAVWVAGSAGGRWGLCWLPADGAMALRMRVDERAARRRAVAVAWAENRWLRIRGRGSWCEFRHSCVRAGRTGERSLSDPVAAEGLWTWLFFGSCGSRRV